MHDSCISWGWFFGLVFRSYKVNSYTSKYGIYQAFHLEKLLSNHSVSLQFYPLTAGGTSQLTQQAWPSSHSVIRQGWRLYECHLWRQLTSTHIAMIILQWFLDWAAHHYYLFRSFVYETPPYWTILQISSLLFKILNGLIFLWSPVCCDDTKIER